jgi:hypothetical protein
MYFMMRGMMGRRHGGEPRPSHGTKEHGDA